MTGEIISDKEREVWQTHPELSQLNQQDFLALKSRLVAGYYYDHTGQVPELYDFDLAYETFKSELNGQVNDANPVSSPWRVEHTAKIGEQYKENGIDLQTADAATINDAARVATTDHDLDTEFAGLHATLVTKLIDTVQSGNSTPEEQALLQGIMRSNGLRNNDGTPLTIDGQFGPQSRRALSEFKDMRSAYFTAEERYGESGYNAYQHTSADPDMDGKADAINETNPVIDPDDAALYVAYDGDIAYGANFDEAGRELTTQQVKVLQGVMNVAYGTNDPLNGTITPELQQQVRGFLASNGMNLPDDTGEFMLDSHDFEGIRNLMVLNTTEVRGDLIQKANTMIEEERTAGAIDGIRYNGVNNRVASVQALANLDGYRTTIDGIYGGQTDKNLQDMTNSGAPIDPDADFVRQGPKGYDPLGNEPGPSW